MIITKNGGAMAHLVTVLREQEMIVARVPDARTLYVQGTKVTINATNGTIELHQGKFKSLLDCL